MDSTSESKPKKLYFGQLLSIFPKGESYLQFEMSASTFQIFWVLHTPNGEYKYRQEEKVSMYSYNPRQPILYTQLAPEDQILAPNVNKIIRIFKNKILDKEVFKYVNLQIVKIKFDESIPYTELLDVPLTINTFMYDIAKDFLNLRIVRESSLQTFFLSIAIMKYMWGENRLVGNKHDINDFLNLHNNAIADDDNVINELGIRTVLNMINKYKSYIKNQTEFLETPDVYYLVHKEENRHPMLGTGTSILYLKNIVFPKSSHKKIKFPDKFKRFINSFPHFSLSIQCEKFEDYTEDGTDIELFFKWTSRLAFKSVKYNLLTGETTSKNKDINYILPRLARFLIQEVFLTGNYTYLNTIQYGSESFTIKCYDGDYLDTSTAKSPHNIIDLLSTIYSKGVDLKFINTYRSFIFIILGVHRGLSKNITTVDEYIKKTGLYTNGNELAKEYSDK